MRRLKKSYFLYGILALIWLLTTIWHVGEHRRVVEAARQRTAERARDVSKTLSVVIRSQGRFGFVPQARLEAALAELAQSTDLKAVVLLNQEGHTTASAGKPLDAAVTELLETPEHWREDEATFVNLVALGPNTESLEPGGQLPLILEPEGRGGPGGEGRRRRFMPPPLTAEGIATLESLKDGRPLTDLQVEDVLKVFAVEEGSEESSETLRRVLRGRVLTDDVIFDAGRLAFAPPEPPGGLAEPPPDHMQMPPPPPGMRPPWMSQQEYEQLLQERGIHWLAVTLPTNSVTAESERDQHLRTVVAGLTLLACFTVGAAYHTLSRSTNLRLQLIRAEETARHLNELNMAAAGLVHETKNPLNLIRGMAQIISRDPSLAGVTRETAVQITEESDRVTSRLNEFLEYSRPVKPRVTPVLLPEVVKSVFSLLEPDRSEKSAHFAYEGPEAYVLADHEMLRQVIFNLLLNAIEAVSENGRVRVRLSLTERDNATLEVIDDGRGVPEQNHDDIFTPYFTTSATGTGLGLTIVRQIAHAHHWEVKLGDSQAEGTVFQLTGLAIAEDRTQA